MERHSHGVRKQNQLAIIAAPNAISNKITEIFSEYGTHYVPDYEMGDIIYQVFVYDKDSTEAVLRFPPFSKSNINGNKNRNNSIHKINIFPFFQSSNIDYFFLFVND